jgi:hypothetical protein
MMPELYLKIKGKSKEAFSDYQSNDWFALGQSMLSLFTASGLVEVYKPNGEFDHTKEQELI